MACDNRERKTCRFQSEINGPANIMQGDRVERLTEDMNNEITRPICVDALLEALNDLTAGREI